MATHTPAQRLVLWVIWASIFSSLFVYKAFLGGSAPGEEEAAATMGVLEFAMLIVPAAACVGIRFFLIPAARNVTETLVVMIIGLAIGEGIIFLGLFLFPAFANLFFVVSVLAVLLFAPVYAHRGQRASTSPFVVR